LPSRSGDRGRRRCARRRRRRTGCARSAAGLGGSGGPSRATCVDGDRPAREAARTLLEHEIGALPVVDGERKLRGIISSSDFLAIAAEALDVDAHRAPRRRRA